MPSLGGALGGAATGAKIGSIAGPWGTAIGAAAGGIMGLFSGGKSKLQKNMEAKIDPAMNDLMHWAGQSRDKQNQMFGIALPAMQNAGSFYNALLSKNSTQALQGLMGPQQTAINDQYQAALNQIAMSGPRGGGKNQTMANAGFDRNRAMMELIPQLRMQAAQGALNVGQQAGGQAIDWGNMSSQQMMAVLSAATGGTMQGMMGRQAEKDAGWAGITGDLGKILYDSINKIKTGRNGSGPGGTNWRINVPPMGGKTGGGLWDSLG